MIQASGLNHDVERLAVAIRDAFLVDRDLAESDVQKIHYELLACVNTANARLKECDELLRQGLRQEALQEVEEEPNLLELVTQLDFPEWDAWADYVRQFGLPPQPPLLLNVAAELNQAYTTAESLEGLLKLHRLHALARSPLAARVALLRVIATRDPHNPSWQHDLKAYETARFKQLHSEFKSRLKEGDLRAVAELHRELESSDWSVSPPETMVNEVTAGHQRLIAEDARRHLAMLEPKINAAFSAFDMPALQHARDTWNRFWPLAILPTDDSLAIRVRPAFAWLDDEISQQTLQAEYERELVELDAALDDEKTQRHDIVRMYGAIERYNEPIPARLQRRYDERLLSLDLTSRRKHRLVLLTSVITVALIAASIGILAFQQLRKSEVAAAEKALKEFVDDNRPQQGAQFYEQLLTEKPHIANAPQVQAAYARVQGQITDEVERQDRLAQLLDNANESLVTPTWESVTAADKLLKEAHSLAANDGEKVKVLTIDRTVQEATSGLQRTVDAQFEKEASDLRRAVGSDATLTMAESSRLLQEAQTLQKRQRVSSATRQASGIDILVQKLNDRIKQLTFAQNTQELLQNVIHSCGRASAYQSAIQRYLEIDTNSSRAIAFRQVLDQDISLINAQSDWNTTANAWNGLSLKSVTDAKTALNVIETLKKSFPEYPFLDDVLALQPYIESISAREKADGSTLLGELRELLKDNLFNMKQLRIPRQNDFFYYFGEPMKKATSYEISVLLDSRDWTKTKLQRLSLEQFKTAEERTKSQDSPQKLFADRANRALANENATYEHTLCGVLHLLFADEDMDPILNGT